MLYSTILTLFFGLITPYTRTFVFIYGYLILAVGGVFNGYFTARAMRWFGLQDRLVNTLIAALALPTYILVSIITIDFIEYEEQSDSYIPLTSLAMYALVWFLLSIPLSFYGSYRG